MSDYSHVGYEVEESSAAAPRPTGGHRVDYGFIDTMDANIRHQRAEEVGYGIRDVWVDLAEAVEEVAPTTLEGVTARVTELAAVKEQDTQDIYVFHHETELLLDQEALASREAWAHLVGLSLVVHYELQAYKTHTQIHDFRIALQESLTATLIAQISSLQGQFSAALGQIRALQARDQTHADDSEDVASTVNNMPPKRTSAATARAATAAARAADADAAATLIKVAAVEQLIKPRVSAALANHETLRNSTNGHGNKSHNSGTRTKGITRTPRDLKGTDITSYTLHFQELALMCGRMFPEESDEVEKYVGGLPDMIRGNVMSYQPKTMEEAIEFAND
ncbi:hypothetical protein Tco_1389245 [Tanacetum coccineum]